jgi:Tol biopolymer transport system component
MGNHKVWIKISGVIQERKAVMVTKYDFRRLILKLVIPGAVVSVLIIMLFIAFDTSFPIAQAAFPGINGKIAFASDRDGNYEIYVMNADGTNQTRLTFNNTDEKSPAWSPDGTKVAFISDRDGNNEIYVMEADGTNQTRLTNNTVDDASPSWSPDGAQLVFVHSQENINDVDWIYVMESDGTNQIPLITLGGWMGDVTWSPNGTRIAFISEAPPIGFEIYAMDANGSNLTRLTYDISGMICFPDWSPNGSKIAFSDCYFPYAGEIYEINPDGTGLVNLTNSPFPMFDINPAWAPDGTKITFQSSSGGSFDIHVMNTDGTDRKNISNHPADDIDADWQPLSLIDIDIKPDSYPNGINLNSMGRVPVAILTTDDFDATTVDPTSVIFAGAYPIRWTPQDVDYDGDLDLIFHFRTQELNLDENSTDAKLEGETFSGLAFYGIDTVKIKK